MKIHDLEVTGSLIYNGVNLLSLTSSVTDSGSFSTQIVNLNQVSSSLNSFTSSINTTIKSKLDSESVISGSAQVSITDTTGYSTFSSSISSSIGSLSGSVATTTSGLAGRIGTIEGSYATTGSNAFIGTQTITGSFNQLGDMCVTGNITSAGQIIAQTINVQQVTSSIVYSCGSNTFGCSLTNNQVFTGSMLITGSNIDAKVTNTCFSGTVCGLRFVAPNLTICGGDSNALISSDNNEVLRIQGHCPSGMFASFMSGSAVLGDLGNTSQVFASGNATGFGINARGTRTLEFGTNQASRLSISSTGEATFTCQMCAPNATITNCLGVGVSVPQGNFEVLGLSYFTRTNNSLLINPNYGGFNTHTQLQVGCNMGLAFATNGDCEKIRITNGGDVGIGTCVPNAKLTVWTPSTTGLQTALRLNNPFGFDNLNTGAQIVFSQDRSIAEDLKQGIIAVGQQDAGTSATSYMAFYTNNTGLGERLRISSTGVACFSSMVCAPQYITTQGSSVSYVAGTNYIVWNSEGEICSQDNNTGGTYTTMKTWIADRTGCLTLRFAGYIQSGPNYWAWRVVRNGSTSLVCGDYLSPLAPSCSTSVHSYTTFQSNIGPVNPGDCITLQMVSSTGGGVPVNGAGQFLFAKELRLHSTTPNFSAGSSSNIFGDRLGVGTNTPCTAIDVRLPIVYGVAGSTLNSYPIATFTERDCAGGARGLEIGVPAASVDSPVYLKVINTSARFSILDSSNCSNLTIAGGVACFSCTVCAATFMSKPTTNGYDFRAGGFNSGTIAGGGSYLAFSCMDRGLYLLSIASGIDSSFGYSAFLWVNSSSISVTSVLRQNCVSISTSGRALCVTNQYTAEAGTMQISTLHLVNYIG